MNVDISNGGAGLGVMELFIMTLVGKLGLKSLYELRQQAGLEPGGIRSAMRTLEKEKLISRTDPGKRHRRDLALTTAGSAFLEQFWRQCDRDYPDAEAVLRAAFVAWVMDCPAHAVAYLEKIGQSRRERTQLMQHEQESLKRSQTGPVSSYAWMRLETEAHRRRAESDAFVSISLSLKELFEGNVNKKTESSPRVAD